MFILGIEWLTFNSFRISSFHFFSILLYPLTLYGLLTQPSHYVFGQFHNFLLQSRGVHYHSCYSGIFDNVLTQLHNFSISCCFFFKKSIIRNKITY